ncbi:hypothetical protein GCM10007933_08150 [Zoogloea oryzae]|uniref:Uncharacterized protein n=1 Tax=Zoogloea oryzae TaxID=310767 RepID=A0ABQ6F728_9RHOO|nr:hypothetical protein [Zoogloea oryzae]GLT21363.1 hypothetical protein GCM10007933_08150 [Zoogloea oryzae]
MSHPANPTNPTSPGPQTSYLRLLEADAPTLSGSSAIRYAVFASPDRSQVFLTIVGNRGGGNWNREVVSLADIETALADVPAGEPFGSKLLRLAFVGRSNNNPPFLAAALVHAGLLAPAEGVKHKLVRTGDCAAWADGMLAHEGEPVLFPPGTPASAHTAEPSTSPATTAGKPLKKGKRSATNAAPAADQHEESDHADHP